MSEVKLYKTIAGEFIIGTVLKDTQFTVQLKDVVRIMVMPVQGNEQPALGFADWCPFAKDKNLTIQKQHLMSEMEPVTEILNAYQKQFGQLVTPPSGLILPPK